MSYSTCQAPIQCTRAGPPFALNQYMTNIVNRMATQEIEGLSEKVRRLEHDIAVAALSDATVMLSGEDAAEKKFIAHTIHQQSRRTRGPFVVTTCEELIGPVGSGDSGKIGNLMLLTARGGTLFVQDIEKIPAELQGELVAFVDAAFDNDVRLITASHCDLFEYVRVERFSRDLFYRLNVIHLFLSPGAHATMPAAGRPSPPQFRSGQTFA